MPRRKPHDRCAVCERTIEEICGVRLIATPGHSISIHTPHDSLGAIRHPAKTIRLEGDYRDVIVVFHGPRLWTDEVIQRVASICQSGQRPWFCQKCADIHLCPTCKTPMSTAPMTDRLDDDGHPVHTPNFVGYHRRCINPDCPTRRPNHRFNGLLDDQDSETT